MLLDGAVYRRQVRADEHGSFAMTVAYPIPRAADADSAAGAYQLTAREKRASVSVSEEAVETGREIAVKLKASP